MQMKQSFIPNKIINSYISLEFIIAGDGILNDS